MLLTITPPTPAIVTLPGRQFVLGSLVVACAVLMVVQVVPLPAWLLAAEVFATILGLFLFGSFRYQVHKDPFTYGMALVIVATFLIARVRQREKYGLERVIIDEHAKAALRTDPIVD